MLETSQPRDIKRWVRGSSEPAAESAPTVTIATLRPDGWPQATTVGYVSEGLVLYFLCGRQSQKAVNIAADNRISLVIDHDLRFDDEYRRGDPAVVKRVFDAMMTMKKIDIAAIRTAVRG